MSWQTILKLEENTFRLAKKTYRLIRELYYSGLKYSADAIYEGDVEEFSGKNIAPLIYHLILKTQEICTKLSLPIITGDITDGELTARMPQKAGKVTLSARGESKFEELIKLMEERKVNTINDYYILE